MDNNKATLRAQIVKASTVFSAKEFIAAVSYAVILEDGSMSEFTMVFSNNDPEFAAMLNDYGARKSAELLK